MAAPVRVRIAPSPTGFFHVGNARTALFNWLFARQQGGRFIVRIEDTDRARFVEGALEDMYASLEWLGLEPDESDQHGGSFGPYRQSERLELYHEHVRALLGAGEAYRCYCTPERLEAVRTQRSAAGLKHGYDRHCRNLDAAEVARLEALPTPSVVRLKMPLVGEIVLTDALRGTIRFAPADLEDVILLKTDGFPTYHLAVVVDDHLMAISHVLRADEWIPSAPIQVRLFEAFGWPEPVWVHVPIVLNPSGEGKLSKRKTVDAHGRPVEQMTQVREYQAAGYLPEAMVNYLALLGWAYSADEDVFTVDEAIERFRIEDIKTGPAAWNPEKLAWLNGVWIRRLDAAQLGRRLAPFFAAAGLPATEEELGRLAPMIQERITTLADAVDLTSWLWRDVSPAPDDLVPAKLDPAATGRFLGEVAKRLESLADWSAEALESACRDLAEAKGLKPRDAFQPIRVAVTGSKVSPPLFESMAALGRDRTLLRLAGAAGLLERAPA